MPLPSVPLVARQLLTSVRSRVERPVRNLAYELRWSYLTNPWAAREYRSRPPPLDKTQQQIVEELRARGIARAPAEELQGPGWEKGEVLDALLAWARTPEVLDAARRYQENPDQVLYKHYVVRMFPPDAARIPWHHPLLRLALDPRLLDVVSAYLGQWAKLLSVNAWYTVPLGDPTRQRIASQKWHRDPEDRRLLKVFLYATDVDEASGPLEYVPSTRTDGEAAHLAPLAGGVPSDNYPSLELVEKEIASSERVVATCAAGSFLLCDTSGFHRGGFTLASPRVLAVLTYVTRASSYQRMFEVVGAPPAEDLPIRRALLD